MGGGSGALRWRWWDYRKYADGEWDEIGQAVGLTSTSSVAHQLRVLEQKGYLKRDPNRGLQSLLSVTLNFVMPGHAMPGFGEMSEVVERAGIFGGREYSRIVDELLDFWDIGKMEGLSAEGRAAQDKLMAVPARIAKVADYADRKRKPRDYRFDFLAGREIRL